MRVLVCGGRDFRDKDFFWSAMSEINKDDPVSVVIHGDANGADYLAVRWAVEKHLPIDTFTADWNAHGRAAGPIRNQRMVDDGKPDLVVAFPGGRGTADMIRRAQKAGIRVVEPVSVHPR